MIVQPALQAQTYTLTVLIVLLPLTYAVTQGYALVRWPLPWKLISLTPAGALLASALVLRHTYPPPVHGLAWLVELSLYTAPATLALGLFALLRAHRLRRAPLPEEPRSP